MADVTEAQSATEAADETSANEAERRGSSRLARVLRIALATVVLTALGVGLWYFQNQGDESEVGPTQTVFGPDGEPIEVGVAEGQSRALVGAPAPDFTLLDLAGQPVTLSTFRGQVVILNFWASWCPPCRSEFPLLQSAYEDRADDGLIVIAVNQEESSAEATRFADEFGLTMPVVLDSTGEVGEQYRLLGLPQSVFIDKSGIVRAVQIGEVTNETLTEKIEDLLGDSAAATGAVTKRE